MAGWKQQVAGFALLGVMTGVASAPAEVSAQDVLRYECVALSAKTGGISDICTLFATRLGAANPGRSLQRSADVDADVVLVVDTATDVSLALRIDWKGHPPGEKRGIVRRGARIDDAARAQLIDDLLSRAPG